MPAPSGTWSTRLPQPPRSLVDDLRPDEVVLDERARHHLERVLRLRVGEAVELVDGRGGLARARWAPAGRARIEERLPPQPPPRDAVVLAVAPPRLPRLEWLVEKGLEAGGTFVAVNNKVSQSVPHLHTHVVPRTKGDGLRGFFWPRTKYADGEAEEFAGRIRAALT